jgi:DNA polymerase elongation subunit (family B)
MVKAYIYSVHPILINDEIIWDIYYVTETTKNLNIIRVYNITLSIMIARLPGFTEMQFVNYLTNNFLEKCDYVVRKDLREGSFFDFETNRAYVEIFSKSPNKLKNIYNKFIKFLPDTYARLNLDDLSPEDLIFYKNTETPFRLSSCGISLYNSIYLLPTKYKIPLIGGVDIDINALKSFPPQDALSEFKPQGIPIKYLNAHHASATEKNLGLSAIVRNESIDLKEHLKLMSYDIETYNKSGNLDPTIEENCVYCIGVGMFNLNSSKPFKSLCLVSSDFDEIPPNAEEQFKENHKCYLVKNEYSSSDEALYIITEDEKDLLETFIVILQEQKPQFITGFNTFGFDDNYIFERMRRYGLTDEYLQTFTPYSLQNAPSWFSPFIPKFSKFALKIDNEPYENNQTVQAQLVCCTDVYKILLKEDPKRFTQYGRGNLNSMLDTYHIVSPYNGKPLQKTDMSIPQMFKFWEERTHIYEIALYCRQDAWICGTLLNARNKLTDFIETAIITNTSISDSIYKADGFRVSLSILAYAYSLKFAYMDIPSPFRHDTSKEIIKKLGGKEFDKRTIIGGAVRNITAGRHPFVIALDFASQYPSQKEASNIDSSSCVDNDVVENPDKYDLEILSKTIVNDMYGKREIFIISPKQ